MSLSLDFTPAEMGERFSVMLREIGTQRQVRESSLREHLLLLKRTFNVPIATTRIYLPIDIHCRSIHAHCYGDCAWGDCSGIVGWVATTLSRNGSCFNSDVEFFRHRLWRDAVYLPYFLVAPLIM